ncbi:radical SAM peptide maturase [Bacteroides thetaiotaomicron]|uniref:Radical SAM peptide maturase n=2 Tax=Bacteroides thetaiotaomicron TaxID=818 RepID=A0A7J5JSB8_BACT4|nr:radical SAM peptide maturase [Bacteroides thetaiotaomicron]KAB4432960.1 radical SAM peptide maturase [Bacteroides thetaiotaomicron]KAB4436768.1 radical SAM peptide maturase [Bacteroides thetaiotaomicron]KAB4441089.1 radical SAM peptide maturase [Bacteroides thetaiotaomicron]KAB4454327.1 radical SAM peptide maturase [Bacteroides thetaiotaomicron]
MMKEYRKISHLDIEYSLANLKQLVFEVTDACNLRCKYCAYADLYEGYDQRENLKLPFQKAKLIIDYLYEYWEKRYCIEVNDPITIGFYGGEPLLNVPFIQQVINYIESLNPIGKKFHYNMTTNAILLDRYMDFLAENEFRLLISLDGDEKGQSYRVDTKGKNSFDKVLANIQLLRSKYPSYFEHYVMFNSVLHNRNEVESTYRFIKDKFGKEPMISPLNNSGVRKDKLQEFYQAYQNVATSIQKANNCEALKNELFIKSPETGALVNYIYHHTGNVFNDYNDLLLGREGSSFPPSGTCIPFSKKMFITVKGRILQCEKIDHEFALGQITNKKVELNLEQAARQHNKYTFRYMNQCKTCAAKQLCTQCVYQIDDIHDKTSKCYSYYSATQHEKQKEYYMDHLDKHPELYNRILKEVVVRG